MLEGNPRGAIIYATGMEEKTISRQFAPNESSTLLEYVLDSVWTVADELIVVFDNPEPKLSLIEAISPFGVKVLTTAKGQTRLNMIYNAFKSAKSEHCLLTTERIPLLKPNVALSLFENAQGYDLAIPKWKNGKTEPLLAVYRRKAFVRMTNAANRELNQKAESKNPTTNAIQGVKEAVSSLVDRLFDVKYVPVETELKELDPELDSFIEVKDERSLQLARSKASVKAKRIMKQAK